MKKKQWKINEKIYNLSRSFTIDVGFWSSYGASTSYFVDDLMLKFILKMKNWWRRLADGLLLLVGVSLHVNQLAKGLEDIKKELFSWYLFIGMRWL